MSGVFKLFWSRALFKQFYFSWFLLKLLTVSTLLSANPYDDIDIYLHTVDLGLPMAEKYGHTQIRVHNRRANTDLTYSFGIYDNTDPYFVYNFVKGIMIYRSGVFSTSAAMNNYLSSVDKVWEDRLNLSRQQKRILINELQEQLKPQNSSYRYHYFFNNCATKPRDIIDLALGHELYNRTVNAPSTWTFRESVRVHQATTPLSGLGLEILMNSRLDRPMTLWEEMFLPKSLRQVLLELPALDERGQRIANANIATPLRMLADGTTPTANYRRDYVAVWLWFFVPLLTLAYFLYVFPRLRWPYWFFGFYVFTWGLLSGLLGILMVFFWSSSQHLDLHHNANLYLLWPTDTWYMLYGFFFLFGMLPPRFIISLTKMYAVIHIVVILFAMSALMLGIIKQDLSRTLLTVGLLQIMINLLVLIVPQGRRRN